MLKRTVNARGEGCTGEIANISIGSASTVLSTLLNQPVTISTPNVEAINVRHYDGVPVPFVILNVDFVEGLKNENVFVFYERCCFDNGRFNDDGNRGNRSGERA